jgi:hypothetical protein
MVFLYFLETVLLLTMDVDMRRPCQQGDEQCTTHPQPHEPLLVGWLVGGTTGESRG